MKVELFQYKLPLKKKLTDNSDLFKSGFYIKLYDERGNTGWGEISTYPDYSDDNLSTIKNQIFSFNENYKNISFEKLFGSYQKSKEIIKTNIPCLSFGIDMAISNLSAKRSNLSLKNYFLKNKRKKSY